MMQRRVFMAGIAAVMALPVGAEAQQVRKPHVIGYLAPGSMSSHGGLLPAFQDGLRELGYEPGKDIIIESRWAEGQQTVLRDLALELVRLKVDVIVTSGTPAPLAARDATTTIPIVVMGGSGLAASLARPGANVSGLSLIGRDLAGKRLQLFRELHPGLSHVAVVWNPANPTVALMLRATEVGAHALGMKLSSLEVRRSEDLDSAFNAAAGRAADAVVVLDDPLTVVHRARIVSIAARHRLPVMYGLRQFPEAGGLISYGPNLADLYRRGAGYVDRILKGARIADLPVEEPTTFELVINLKTVRALGLTIPPSLLLRADQVIE